MSDPTAQMGFHVGQTALKHGTEYMEQNVGHNFPAKLSRADICAVQSICERICSQALLQRLEWLCGGQIIPGALPMEAQAIVKKAIHGSEWSRGMVPAPEG